MSQPTPDESPRVAELLTPPHNYAVVQLPGRRFPGVVVQGDSLSVFCEGAKRVAMLAAGTAADDEAAYLCEELNSVLRSYIRVLESRSIELPFTYRPPDLDASS
jgi:hypothetical protein